MIKQALQQRGMFDLLPYACDVTKLNNFLFWSLFLQFLWDQVIMKFKLVFCRCQTHLPQSSTFKHGNLLKWSPSYITAIFTFSTFTIVKSEILKFQISPNFAVNFWKHQKQKQKSIKYIKIEQNWSWKFEILWNCVNFLEIS